MARVKKSQRTEFKMSYELNPKQIEFWKSVFDSPAKYILYGGAKGGGKTFVLRLLAVFCCFKYPGIRILIIRETFDEVRQNHIEPILKMVPGELRSFNGQTNVMTFPVGHDDIVDSTIKFGNWEGADSEDKYNGQEYDLIIIDEASHFYERMFNMLKGCARGTNEHTELPDNWQRKILMATNPGGVGHMWLKRLYIDKRFIVDNDNPERTENPEEYAYIKALAEDNIINLQQNPDYLKQISQMPNYQAFRYGDWEILSGQYFDNFDPQKNVMKSFSIPQHWNMYRAIDYGLDMFVGFWFAVDTDMRCWLIRSTGGENINVEPAADMIRIATLPNEESRCQITYAGPDLWGRSSISGKSTFELMNGRGVCLYKANNDRVQGHLQVRQMLDPKPLRDPYVKQQFMKRGMKVPEELPMLMFFDNVGQVLEDIQSIQHDEKNPSDCAKDPHEITHTIDALRYFCISRVGVSIEPKPIEPVDDMLPIPPSTKSQLLSKQRYDTDYIRGNRHGI